jgi:hypothetical protein
MSLVFEWSAAPRNSRVREKGSNSKKKFKQFLQMHVGPNRELQTQLIIAHLELQAGTK